MTTLPSSSPWLAASAPASGVVAGDRCGSYRVGDGYLTIGGAHPTFRSTVDEIFGDCAADVPADDARPVVHCSVHAPQDDGTTRIDLGTSASGDLTDFALAVFRDRGIVELPPAPNGWRILGLARPLSSDGAANRAVLAIRDETLVGMSGSGWEGLVANLAIACLMREQDDCLFFHAGSVAVAGGGVMLCGAKESGKTTLALALAARGHPLLGDEIAAVRLASRELVPVARAVSVRDGPGSPAIRQVLAWRKVVPVRFPDGVNRSRIRISELFPATRASPVPLRAVVHLGAFSATPSMRSATTTRTSSLSPLAATVWGERAGRRAFQLLRLLGSVPTFHLDPASPDETAALIERTLIRQPDSI